MKLQSKNYEILNKQKLRKRIYIYLPLTCFLFRNSLTTIYSRTIISSSSGMSCKSSVSKIAAEFSPFVFLPLSTRAYFRGRAYIKIILKNHARSYFAGRSYYRGNTVFLIQFCHDKKFFLHSFQFNCISAHAWVARFYKSNFFNKLGSL